MAGRRAQIQAGSISTHKTSLDRGSVHPNRGLEQRRSMRGAHAGRRWPDTAALPCTVTARLSARGPQMARQLTAIGRCTPSHWVGRCLPHRREMKEGPKIIQGKERRKRREKKEAGGEQRQAGPRDAVVPEGWKNIFQQLSGPRVNSNSYIQESELSLPTQLHGVPWEGGPGHFSMTVTRSNEYTVLCIFPKLFPPSSYLMTYGAVLGEILTGEALLKYHVI